VSRSTLRGQKWLARLAPVFIEFCDNLIFRRRAELDNLGERLIDGNRMVGQPNKITVILDRRISKHHRGKLQTEIEDMNLPNPNPQSLR
jgi:hypothetical protein